MREQLFFSTEFLVRFYFLKQIVDIYILKLELILRDFKHKSVKNYYCFLLCSLPFVQIDIKC